MQHDVEYATEIGPEYKQEEEQPDLSFALDNHIAVSDQRLKGPYEKNEEHPDLSCLTEDFRPDLSYATQEYRPDLSLATEEERPDLSLATKEERPELSLEERPDISVVHDSVDCSHATKSATVLDPPLLLRSSGANAGSSIHHHHNHVAIATTDTHIDGLYKSTQIRSPRRVMDAKNTLADIVVPANTATTTTAPPSTTSTAAVTRSITPSPTLTSNNNSHAAASTAIAEAVFLPDGTTAATTTVTKRMRHTRRTYWILAAVVVAVLLVIVASVSAVGATGGYGGGGGGANPNATSDPKSNPPTATDEELLSPRAQAIVDYTNNVTLSGFTFVLPLETEDPIVNIHEMALRWIILHDPLKLSPDTPTNQFRLRQRYALRLFFVQEDSASPWTKHFRQ